MLLFIHVTIEFHFYSDQVANWCLFQVTKSTRSVENKFYRQLFNILLYKCCIILSRLEDWELLILIWNANVTCHQAVWKYDN